MRVKYYILFIIVLTTVKIQAQTNNFTNGGGDHLWSNPLNWSAGTIPTTTSDVTIQNDYCILDINATVNLLSLHNDLQGTGNLTVNTEFNWESGTITGQGDIILNATTIYFYGSGIKTLERYMQIFNSIFFDGGKLHIAGTGELEFHSNIEINNPPLTTTEISGTGVLNNVGTGQIIQQGGGNCIYGLGEDPSPLAIVNGDFRINETVGIDSDIEVQANGDLILLTNVLTTDNATISGFGNVSFGGTGTTTVGGPFLVDGTVEVNGGGNVNFIYPDIAFGSLLNVVWGTIDFSSGTAPNVPIPNLDIYGSGIIQGSDDILITSSFNFFGGSILGNSVIELNPNVTATFGQNATKTLGRILNSFVPITWTAGNINLLPGGEIIMVNQDFLANNNNGGVNEIYGNGLLTLQGNAAFRKSGNFPVVNSLISDPSPLFIEQGVYTSNAEQIPINNAVNVSVGATFEINQSIHLTGSGLIMGLGDVSFANFLNGQVADIQGQYSINGITTISSANVHFEYSSIEFNELIIGGTASTYVLFNNDGTDILVNDLMVTEGTMEIAENNKIVAQQVDFSGGGNLAGEGTLNNVNPISINSHISPGKYPGNSYGILHLEGNTNISANNTLHIEIGGTSGSGNANGNDAIGVLGDLSLNGTLSVTSSYVFQPGDALTIATYTGNLSGTFSNLDIPPYTIVDYTLIPGEVRLVHESVLSINDIAKNKTLIIYPNPTSKYIYFNSEYLSIIESINLYNMNGKSVFSSSQLSEKIDISSFNPGIYLLKIQVGNQTTSHKIVKQ